MKISPQLLTRLAYILGLVSVTALAQPIITSQPQGQAVMVGTNVEFSVKANSLVASPSLPNVGSGTLRLWLKADAGVVTNGAGQVSAWQDQSGNGNDAAQANVYMQPHLITASNLGGGLAVQFNGIQNGSDGDYLFGSGDVGTPNAMTAFTVYNVISATSPANIAWLIGNPPDFGGCRGHAFLGGDLDFTTWAYDYPAPYTGPLNTYRICTDRLDANLTTVQVYDQTLDFATNFSFSMRSAGTPAPGYYVGGLNFVNPDNFNGDIAELICYQGYLSDADRLAVVAYLEEKYYQIGETNGLSYQWELNQTNIAGATNAIFTVTNAQPRNAGTYAVVVGDSNGRTVSSNAVLTVGYPPSIIAEPQSQEVALGTNVFFTINASGTGPFNYQWHFNGSAVFGATNSNLLVTNVQITNAGDYNVSVNGPFGTAVSSTARLIVDYLPVISAPPHGQNVIFGGNFTLSVSASGSTALTTLPAVSSGALRLWLKADAGVAANSSGQVSLWQDQSGNTNDATQSNPSQQPLLVYPAGIQGEPAVRFDGIQDGANGDYLYGNGDVGTPTALTAFTVYSAFAVSNAANILWFIGSPGNFGAGRGHSFLSDELNFTTWGFDYETPYTGPLNTYRICTDEVDTNLTTVQIYDQTANASTNFTYSMHNATFPSPGYFVGGLNFAEPDNFDGDIAEVICYRGSLTDVDRLAVIGYLQQKYYKIGAANGLMYQWQFDGTNIDGATNSAFTVTNAQLADSGFYTVVVSNLFGSLLSSNALISVGFGPSIIIQPQNATATLGNAASFNVAATGSDVLAFQWQFQGVNIDGATNDSLAISNIAFSNLGVYTVSVSNAWLTVTSSPAVLAFNPQITIDGELGTNFGFTNVPFVRAQINSTFTNASIFYTLDGSEPDFNATPYNGPIDLIQSSIIRAVAYDQNFNVAQSLSVNLVIIISNRLSMVDPGGGIVTFNPPGGLYRNTQTVQVTATPTNGWSFLQWSGAVSSTNPVINVSMLSNLTVRAIFGTSLSIIPPSNGIIHLDPPAVGFPFGSVVEISAVPASGYYFALWGGGTLSGSGNPFALTIRQPNPSVAALFAALAPGHFSLTVIPNGNGSVLINPQMTSYLSNTIVQIHEVPQTTNRFYYWTGSVTSSVSFLTLAIRTNLTITANFSGGTYPVQFSAPSIMSTNVQFTLTAEPLGIYEVDVSTDLVDWTFFQIVTNTAGTIHLSDFFSNSSEKYYRASSRQ